MITAKNATVNETCAPAINRARRSRPFSSVPRRCPATPGASG
jgi:hypothetical protein